MACHWSLKLRPFGRVLDLLSVATVTVLKLLGQLLCRVLINLDLSLKRHGTSC